MAVRILKKRNSKEHTLVCCRCGKTIVYENEDIIIGDDNLCYVFCANKRCKKSNYVGTRDVAETGSAATRRRFV
jgi:hypothetical protein